jgi:mannose-6-phosphate isomerase-like protein (cupin superfamily)
MRVINTENAEHYTWGAGCDGWRLLNGADLAVIQECIPPGRGEVKHYHARSRQLFYVLEGRLQIEMADDTAVLRKGDSLEVPPTIPHRVWNPFEEKTVFLVVSAPATTGDRVHLEPPPTSGP